jgi:hypothetical protein
MTDILDAIRPIPHPNPIHKPSIVGMKQPPNKAIPLNKFEVQLVLPTFSLGSPDKPLLDSTTLTVTLTL